MSARRRSALALAAAMLLATPIGTIAHGPDPTVGGALWAQGQEVAFGWRSGAVPPPRVREAIIAAADDSNASRGSRAAIFVDGGGQSRIGYGAGATCGVNGIACFDRSRAPDSFVMWFREQGHVFDWGTLKWCQQYSAPPNGCYDVENVALDEFGHVLILGHHDNRADDSDYLDAVVQTVSRTKPTAGWNEHDYGRCDVATLQLRYDVQNPTARFSTCLSIGTRTTLAAGSSSVPSGSPVTFTATLAAGPEAAYGRLRDNALSGRAVVLQRRAVGGGAWTNAATMTGTSTPGSYRHTLTPSTTYQWRAVFSKPAGEGLQASSSAAVTVTVGACSSPPCPLSSATDIPGGPVR